MSTKSIEIDSIGKWRFQGEFTTPGARAHFPPDLQIEPVHLVIAIHPDIEARRCGVVVTHTLRANTRGARTLRLHGVGLQNLQVEAPEAEVCSTYDGEEIEVTFAEGLVLGETTQLQVSYDVSDPVTGLYFAGPVAEGEDAARFVVTDHETERARHWLATVDLPAVRPTLEWRIRSESDHTIVANGRLADEIAHEDGTKTSIWKQEQPCPSYLTCFIAGEFERYDDEPFSGAPISYFAPRPHRPEDLHRSFGRTGEMLAWMTEKLGAKLPWPKYYQFGAAGIGGAMENISLVSWDDRFILDEALKPELGWRVDQVNLHEMAHTWFGDIIVCRDYAHAWLKESWATYMEACWLEDDEGRQGMYCDLYGDAQAYFEEADQKYKRPIVAREFNHSWNMYDRHLYPGGACRLHTLREHVGNDAFWEGVQAYVERFSGRVVETEDFRRVMEEFSGRSLVEFFEQWIYSPGYPDLRVSFSWDGKSKQGRFEVTQKQVKPESKEPAFVFDIEVAWWIGSERFTETIPVRGARASGVYPMPTDPDRIRIDPEWKVLHKLEFDPGPARLKAQLEAQDDVIGRIHAVDCLVKAGRTDDLSQVESAYRGETHWSARVHFARALGRSQSPAALETLLRLVTDHQEAMSLAALLDALGAYRDSRIVTLLKERLKEGLPPLATKSAWMALGKQIEGAPIEALAAAAEQTGSGGFAAEGAIHGLGLSRQEQALEPLLRLVSRGSVSEQARFAVPLALGSLGSWLGKGSRARCRDAMVDLLHDRNERVGMMAVRGLSALGDPAAVGALRAYADRISAQDRVAVDRAVAGLVGRSAAGSSKAAEKKVEDLQAQLLALSARLEKIERNSKE